MLTLQNLLDAFAEGGADAVKAKLAEAGLNLASAKDLRQEAADAFQTLYAATDRTADDVASMGVLADVIDEVKATEASIVEAETAAAATADALAARALGTPAEEPAVETAAAETPAADEVVEHEVVTASGQVVRPRVRLSDLAARAPKVDAPAVVEQPKDTPRSSLVAAADVPGFVTGAELDFDGVAKALLARSTAMPTTQVENTHIRKQFALVKKAYPAEAYTDGRDDQAVIDRMADETRLEGGSLVAAGGWCAPSETWYDLCPGLESRAGILDLPTVVATRGGVKWTQGPQFCDFYSGTGFFTMTEAQDIAGFTKPCFEIPCPEFEECRLDVYGLCLTAGILQNKGYPEYVRRFIEGTLVAHAHMLNALKIQKMVAMATPVTPAVDPACVGATAALLDSLELYVESYRYRFRMDPDRSLEMVAPYWLRGVIRSDLSKRTGVPMESVTDADIRRWFAERGVRVQFVYDWQDALCGTDDAAPATPIGGDWAGVTAWPDTVQLLIYPAGTFVELTQDVITLENVYDSALFRQNRYTAIFTEEAFCIINRCYEALLLTVPVCPSGVTSGTCVPACPTV